MRIGTAKDAAAVLGVPVGTVYRLAQVGELPVLMRIGPRLRFDMDAIEAWTPPAKPLTRAGTPRRVRLSKGVDWELTDEQVAALPEEGYVYFLQASVGGPIKIGTAQNIGQRMASIQSMSPFPLVLLASSRGGRQCEYRLHRRFDALRIHGEWFKPTPELVGFVSDLAASGRQVAL